MALRLNHDVPPESGPETASAAAGWIVLLGEAPRADWRVWRVSGDRLSGGDALTPGEDATPWDEDEVHRVIALAPAALAPVRIVPRGDMPMAQALAATRLDPPGLRGAPEATHVAVAAGADGETVLSAAVAKTDMDVWLAELAANGVDAAAILPAALALPAAEAGQVMTGTLGAQPLARSPAMAFAGEDDLVAALAPDAQVVEADEEALARRMLAQFAAPELDLRQGAYALPRVSYFRLPDWRQLARMTAILALLVLAIFLVETVKLNLDADAREDAAIAAAQARFPGVGDLATAETQIRGELLRRGAGGVAFADSAPAVFAAMQPVPSVKLRNLSWQGDGTLAIRAAAPSGDALNQMLIALQRDGWQITVPPELTSDATGSTIADITVRAP
ncbi:type II secretion system protein GspL [Croceicoccus naphthovorans]|uniref:Uncharacterized protein n=1 Tax=Croceicoccus naphthovorans TaxID=1348774 RepID=A0A0G3XGL4_9SPHN|nr:type II secretion system protein GspL [Croceicoccus naphthovorans]AKM10660.1 hypothetical protein AB433_12900 [Croceicoccus naphthovorans]MBB3988895.1 general secretion pathway protein L [Croceicoccus naphthovorans]